MENRSVPTSVLLPHVHYRSVNQAAAWLHRVFGFEEHYRYGGAEASGAQMRLGDAYIMLHGLRAGKTPAELGYGTQSLTVFVPDVDEHYRRSRAEGARILEEPHETVYGEWQYASEDLDGHRWLFSRHARDVSPESWGATVAR